ncbi:MAG: hypothetical protein QOE76_3366, partial [Frankiales bacterium]|nr:hypothetical protein [Frankiales bacterium]
MRKIRAVAAAIAMVGALSTGAPTAANAIGPTPIGAPVTNTTVTHQIMNGQDVTITTSTTSQRLRKPGLSPNTLTCGQVPTGT